VACLPTERHLRGARIRISEQLKKERRACRAHIGLYTILPSPLLYGARHTKEGSVGGRILRIGRAIVMQ